MSMSTNGLPPPGGMSQNQQQQPYHPQSQKMPMQQPWSGGSASSSGKYSMHSNLNIVNKSVRPFLFTISNVICLVNPQNGSWILFTISQNSLYRSLLYLGLSVLIIQNNISLPILCIIIVVF